jgi:hypothetical protein
MSGVVVRTTARRSLVKRLRARWLLAWASMIVLLALCLCPGYWLPHSESGGGIGVPRNTDKVVHFAMFAVVAALWMRARPEGAAGRAWAAKILVVGVLLAAGTELAQGISILDRDCDLYDALADSAGVVAAVGVMSALDRVASRSVARDDSDEAVPVGE